jgi:predicted esterase
MRNTVNFQFQATFHQSHEITDQTKEIWFVLHGYGQLPQYFIRKFKELSSTERVFIAPGGLSRFYLEGFNGRVGATWMTKEERLLDIENYVFYLNTLYDQVMDSMESKNNIKISLLGFSQGSATVTRWIQSGHPQFERFIIHSGAFPHDMEMPKVKDILADKEIVHITGDDDPFVNEERQHKQRKVIESLELPIKEITFSGGHDIDVDSLKKIL